MPHPLDGPAPPAAAGLLPWERKRRAAGVPRQKIQRKPSSRRGRGEERRLGPRAVRRGGPGPSSFLTPQSLQGQNASAHGATRNPQPQRQVHTCGRRPARSGGPAPRALHPRSLSPCICPQGTRARPQHSPHLPPAPRGSDRAPRHIRSNPAGPRGSRTHTPEGHRPYAVPGVPRGPLTHTPPPPHAHLPGPHARTSVPCSLRPQDMLYLRGSAPSNPSAPDPRPDPSPAPQGTLPGRAAGS